MPGYTEVLDLERGTQRVTWRFPDTSKYKIWVPEVTLGEEELLRLFTMNKNNPVYVGSTDLYTEVSAEYIKACLDPKINNITVDTGKELWECICNGYLQEIQESIAEQNRQIEKFNKTVKTDKEKQNIREQRQRLSEIEYREPNTRMKRFFATARSFNTHLILIHHDRPVRKEMYNQKTRRQEQMIIPDEYEIDGFGATARFCDWVFETGEDKANPQKKWLKIRKSPIGPQVLGLEISVKVGDIVGYDYLALEKIVKKYGREVLVL